MKLKKENKYFFIGLVPLVIFSIFIAFALGGYFNEEQFILTFGRYYPFVYIFIIGWFIFFVYKAGYIKI